MTKKKYISLAALIAFLFTTGCFLSPANERNKADSCGSLTGNIKLASGEKLEATSDTGENFSIIPDREGNFTVKLPAGFYRLALLGEDGQPIKLLQESVEIIDNATVQILDGKMVPIPVIRNVKNLWTGQTSAIIEVETDIPSNSFIEYGKTALYGMKELDSGTLASVHRIRLDYLEPGTLYHFRAVTSRYHLESTKAFSGNYTFTTPL
ncbi:MAG: hypothetical protein GX221_03965 [Candidatus Riflebacteria bacterium]|nr:hypothetical protein [Candidatus Riflebacteria bacterium]